MKNTTPRPIVRQSVLLAGLALLLTFSFASLMQFAQAAPAKYHVLKQFPVSGEGGWDYLTIDAQARRLYIAHSSRVTVMNIDTGKQVAEIPNTQGVHGVAVAPSLNKGFASNGRDNSVAVFNLKTLKETARIKVGKNPDAILYDPFTRRVFTFNGSSNDSTVLDAVSGKILGTIPLGGKPEFAQSDLQGRVFVNIEDKSEIIAIDAKMMTAVAHWPIAPAEEASGLAIDRVGHRLFAVAGNEKMAVLDYRTGKVLATPTIGKGPDAAAFDPRTGVAVSSNGQDGTLTLVHGGNGTYTTQTVPTQRGARTMALDEKTGRIFLITGKYGEAAPGERRPRLLPGSTMILVVGAK